MEIYYSVENCGDGSAYPRFFVSEALADWHQKSLDEGWGEPCTGSIKVIGDNVTCPEAMTIIQCYLDIQNDVYDKSGEQKLKDFVKEFLPDGVPTFTVAIKEGDKAYFSIFVDGDWVANNFAHPDSEEKTRAKVEKELNSR